MITTDLLVGLVLTALAYAGLMWAVVHGKHVVERVKRGEYPDHPNPDHSTAKGGGQDAVGPSSTASADDRTAGDREEGSARE